ncbi:probable glycosyltransferase At5g03795 [Carica papaya]|uniref:probable glycosyltransferase At5g03795 n=1 Tax=Carica papaya TaxID=3649 RepID=UPI000B8CF291|nr:probable glycosyltransferase At5g03795 [Carica papaya]
MELLCQFRKLYQNEKRRWLFLVGIVAVTHLMFQSLLLPYGNALRSLLPDGCAPVFDESSRLPSSTKSVMVRNPLAVNVSRKIDDSISAGMEIDNNITELGIGEGIGRESGLRDREKENGVASQELHLDNIIRFSSERNVINDSLSENDDLNEMIALNSDEDQDDSSILEITGETTLELPMEQIGNPNQHITMENHTSQLPRELNVNTRLQFPFKPSLEVPSLQDSPYSNNSASNGASLQDNLPKTSLNVPSLQKSTYFNNLVSNVASLQGNLPSVKRNSTIISNIGKRKMRCEMPPKSVTTIDEMNQILLRNRRSSRSMQRPRWSSKRDEEILAARSQIENALSIVDDPELYAPAFRNVSIFKRSYELMIQTLKVYVYKDGKKPIFHQPILKGLYASEGWFMKLMEGNKHFLVKDPRRAHLFYMPFSSRMLEYTLYVRNSHNRTNLRQYLKDYAENIAARYPYWNRTGGADHFLVACHDWAPYETRHHMEYCIKALCNADVTAGFKIGRDVSLPETYVRAARNPLRDLGGKPHSQRRILAFYAGNMHGYLRPILLKHWKDKDATHEEQQVLYLPKGIRGQ